MKDQRGDLPLDFQHCPIAFIGDALRLDRWRPEFRRFTGCDVPHGDAKYSIGMFEPDSPSEPLFAQSADFVGLRPHLEQIRVAAQGRKILWAFLLDTNLLTTAKNMIEEVFARDDV